MQKDHYLCQEYRVYKILRKYDCHTRLNILKRLSTPLQPWTDKKIKTQVKVTHQGGVGWIASTFSPHQVQRIKGNFFVFILIIWSSTCTSCLCWKWQSAKRNWYRFCGLQQTGGLTRNQRHFFFGPTGQTKQPTKHQNLIVSFDFGTGSWWSAFYLNFISSRLTYKYLIVTSSNLQPTLKPG